MTLHKNIIIFFVLFFLASPYAHPLQLGPNLSQDQAEEILEISGNTLKQYNLTLSNLIEENRLGNFPILKVNQRKYSKRLMTKIHQSGIEIKKQQNWRGSFKVKLKIPGKNCSIKGKARLTGDLLAHLNVENNFHSVKFNINNGSIDNFSNFKIFTQNGRRSEEELLASLLFKEIGFLSPKTAILNIKFAGKKIAVLFQEDINSEFLENNGFHEGPIIRGSEDYGLGLTLSSVEIKNKSSFSDPVIADLLINIKNDISKVFFQSALQDINLRSALSNKTILSKERFPDPIILPDLFTNNSKDINVEFALLSAALNAGHGLAKDDHRFAFDFLTHIYNPIYYDGDPSFTLFSEPINLPFHFTNKNVELLQKKISSINHSTFYEKMFSLGSSLAPEEISHVLNMIEKNLLLLRSNPHESIYNWKWSKNIEPMVSFWKKNILERSQLNNREFQEDLVFIAQKTKNDVEICRSHNANQIRCEKNEGSNLYSDMIRSPYINNTKINVINFFYPTFPSNWNYKVEKYKTFPGALFKLYGDVKIKIFEKKRQIVIVNDQNQSNYSHVTITGGVFDNWDFVMSPRSQLGYDISNQGRRSGVGLTGCLTFIESFLKDSKIKIENTNCEDAVHFVRTKGENLSLDIIGARGDGVDADFSNISFDKLNIMKTGNDCLDLSLGNYTILNAELQECGDKAISAGGNTELKSKNLIINNAKIGVASKDGSKVYIEKASINQTKISLALYSKKKIYSSPKLLIGELNCDKCTHYSQFGYIISPLIQ